MVYMNVKLRNIYIYLQVQHFIRFFPNLDNRDYYTGESVYQSFDVQSSDIVCVTIIINEDSQIENTETLRVTAIISDPDVVVGPSQVRVYILDRDCTCYIIAVIIM